MSYTFQIWERDLANEEPCGNVLLFDTTLFIAWFHLLTGTASLLPTAKVNDRMAGLRGNLEDFVVSDLETELTPTGSSANVQVVALADRGSGYDTSYGDWQTTKLFHVTQGMTSAPENAVADWGERNFGDKQTLIDFVTWTKANYPANHYALYFWGHGWNWHSGVVMQDDTDDDTLDFAFQTGWDEFLDAYAR
jgi:hypothetical protein